MTAIRALEPVVNLARLQIRAGAADDGRHRLLRLFDAVTAGTSAQFEQVHVPADLTLTDTDRHEVRTWLWKVVLADGTRTLTAAGRWAEALAHLEEHRGVGHRMLDGRQVAVLAALSHSPSAAAALVTTTAPGDRWENSVTGCLEAMCNKALLGPALPILDALVEDYVEHQPDQGMTVFDTRLGLTILDLLEPHQEVAALRMVAELHHRAATATDGYAARECLADPRFVALAELRQVEAARQLVRACALGDGCLPEPLLAQMTEAMRLSDKVIRASVGRPHPSTGAAAQS